MSSKFGGEVFIFNLSQPYPVEVSTEKDSSGAQHAESLASQWPGSPPQWSAKLLHPQLELSPSTPSAGVFLNNFFYVYSTVPF
jgi:hypothetical protein